MGHIAWSSRKSIIQLCITQINRRDIILYECFMCVKYSRPHELPGVQVTQKSISVLEIPTMPSEVTLSLQLPSVPGNLTISGYRVSCWRSQTGECAIKHNFWAVARKWDVSSWCAKRKEDNKEELCLWIWNWIWSYPVKRQQKKNKIQNGQRGN